jgi:hypothetical protein
MRLKALYILLIGFFYFSIPGLLWAQEWKTENMGGMLDQESLIIAVSGAGESACAIGMKKDPASGNPVSMVFSLWENPWGEEGDVSWGETGGKAPADMILSSIAFDKKGTAYIGGAFPGGIFRSLDNCETWTKVAQLGSLMKPGELTGFAFAEEGKKVIVFAADGRSKSSDDGGEVFGEVSQIALPAGQYLTIGDVIQVGEVIFLVGGDRGSPGDEFEEPRPSGSGFVMRSLDFGNGWETMAEGLTFGISKADFISADFGIVVGKTDTDGRAMASVTSDGGATFTDYPIPDFPADEVYKPAMVGTKPVVCSAVELFNENDGIVACVTGAEQGNNLVLRTRNGGQDWETIPGYKDTFKNQTLMMAPVLDAYFPDCSKGYVVGGSLMIRSYTSEETCELSTEDGSTDAGVEDDGRSDSGGCSLVSLERDETIWSLFVDLFR